MRKASFIISVGVTLALVIVLNNNWKIAGQDIPAFGKFLNPQNGCWQNAEAGDKDFTADLNFPGLKGKVNVYLDGRLVPHIFAENENDAYFVQGYLHAKFRLWQMELQTHAAAGRASEIIGEKALEHDREFRRLGMVWAAENSLRELEKDPVIKLECDAYTEGVNAYIESLTETTLPLEYKLIGYKPEKWSNLKTAVFMKYMSYDLAGHDDDFEMTNAKNFFSADDFTKLFPYTQDSLDPIIPKGTAFEKQKVFPVMPAGADSVYLNSKDIAKVNENKPSRDNGSNNWAVSGMKTKTGNPILCNDPHLALNLPSIWYEIQITTPTLNIYGASFPGAPGVMIGFNDSCAFGFTNGGRDVRDYYEIKFKDDSRKEYWFNGAWEQTKWRLETIKIKNRADYTDSVAYVKLGSSWCPVMYDKMFSGSSEGNNRSYAVRWKAHDPSNEVKAIHALNHARNYRDYTKALINFGTPGQNCAFACKNGDIAIRTQGDWPAKWKGQGDFIMPGFDSSYLWQAMIPQDEVPFQYNPQRGFVSSANQKPVDDTNYPYYLGRNYSMYRGVIINKRLAAMDHVTPQEMMALQTDNYNLFAEMARPLLLNNIKETDLDNEGQKYLDILRKWNLRSDVGSKGATVFEFVWDNFYNTVFNDEYAKAPEGIMYPLESTLLEGLLKDTGYKFLDDISTSNRETLSDNATTAFKKAVYELKRIEGIGKLDWEKYKGTAISHLTKLAAFSRKNLSIGGGANMINATKSNHGPSWRMVVSLTEKTEAYGVYPGGQSGNPGSKFYDNFIDYWVEGKYYSLWVMTKEERGDKRIKWAMNFSN